MCKLKETTLQMDKFSIISYILHPLYETNYGIVKEE